MSIVTLTTDFGTRDHYVAVMKSVILRHAPKAQLVDVTHQIPKFNIEHAAMVLRQLVEWFPPGTVHLVVVDPGVGTDRAVMAFRYNGQYVICPDNGLITLVHRSWPFETAKRLNRPGEPHQSSTFHGRDIMAPAAGFLANGGTIDRIGEAVDSVELLALRPCAVHDDGTIEGQVVYVDSFGNLVTNIHRDDVARASQRKVGVEVVVGNRTVGPIRSTYSDVPAGKPVALIGSSDLLELAVNRGNAAKFFRADPGAAVKIQ